MQADGVSWPLQCTEESSCLTFFRWQHSEEHLSDTKSHIPITRCSSTVALSLEGPPISKVRNKGRAAKRITGDVFDPFAPWRVVSVQAYPDWKSSIDSHDSTKHYVNGPEAFMITLRAEYKDAQKRLMEIYTQISHLVRPPVSVDSFRLQQMICCQTSWGFSLGGTRSFLRTWL